jgi:hypothetical protein
LYEKVRYYERPEDRPDLIFSTCIQEGQVVREFPVSSACFHRNEASQIHIYLKLLLVIHAVTPNPTLSSPSEPRSTICTIHL